MRLSIYASASMAVFWLGCGGATTPPPLTPGPSSTVLAPTSPFSPEGGLVPSPSPARAVQTEHRLGAPASLPSLPSAPWAGAPVPVDETAPAFTVAWVRAENRDRCAPLVPTALGSAIGAEARVADELVEGGWAVTFDLSGLPGYTDQGDLCEDCGRNVFGISGTELSVDQLAEEADAEQPGPTFADGSHLSLEPPVDGESVAAASLTVSGEECVYQVWSFLGETHLRALVDGLRRVDVSPAPRVATR